MKMKMNVLLLAVTAVMTSVLSTRATFTVSLELQGGSCSDQLTLICRHSDDGSAPVWIHNGTLESGEVLATAFPGAEYTVQALTEHTATITGVDSVRTLDGYFIQCAYDNLGNLLKSNAIKYSFLPRGQFTLTSVSIGANRNLINVTYMENESDCPDYPTERYTVDVDGVQVADLTADAVQILAINHANSSVTLSLPLNQPLPGNAVTLSMTKYNTVPTNRSDVTGNIVTEMVTWGTSAVFTLRESPPGGEPPVNNKDTIAPGAQGNVGVVIGVSVSVGILVLLAVVGGFAVITVVIARRDKKKKELLIMSTDNPQQEVTLGGTLTQGHDETPLAGVSPPGGDS